MRRDRGQRRRRDGERAVGAWRSGPSAVAALAVAALLLSGCAPAVDDSASAVQAQSFPGVYAQTVEWGECGEDFWMTDGTRERLAEAGAPVETFECGTVEAPLDWNRPESHETIELAAVRIPSTGKGRPIGTLLSNPGGPGESGIRLAYSLTMSDGFAEAFEHYDLIGFDPRGIGRSTPVECESFSNIFELDIAACAKEHPLARSMGTSQVARDMELLRHLSGDDEMHYLGYSYGTMLGATYATLFPERVGRMILDSASAANWAGPTDSFDQSAAIAREIVELLAGCGGEYEVSACPVTGEDALLELMGRFEEQPLVASDGTEVTGGTVYGYLTSSLYQGRAGREDALDLLAGVVADDQGAVDALAEAMGDGGAQVGLAGMVVRCHSFPEDVDLLETLDHIEAEGMPKLMGGPELTDDNLRPYMELACDALPGHGDDITDTFSGSPDAPILVIGITGDHATPYQGAQQLTRELGNARLLTLEGHGHGASYAGRSSCADQAATAYLLRGKLPAEGAVCTDD